MKKSECRSSSGVYSFTCQGLKNAQPKIEVKRTDMPNKKVMVTFKQAPLGHYGSNRASNCLKNGFLAEPSTANKR